MFIDPKVMRFGAAMSSAVLTKGLLLYGAYRAGTWLDGRFGTAPFGMFVLIVAAFALGMWWLVKVAERFRT